MKRDRKFAPYTRRIRGYLVITGQKLRTVICDSLNGVSRNWSQRTKKMYWIFFILIGIGVSLEIAAEAIIKHKSVDFYSNRIRGVMVPPFTTGNKANLTIIYLRIKGYEHYLDSLFQNDTATYNKLIRMNPHLRDSLSKISVTLSQNLNK